jgi:hypothetical protein
MSVFDKRIESYDDCFNLSEAMNDDRVFLSPDQIARAFGMKVSFKKSFFPARSRDVARVILEEGAPRGTAVYRQALEIFSEIARDQSDRLLVCKHSAGISDDLFDKHFNVYLKHVDSYQDLLPCYDFDSCMNEEQKSLFREKMNTHQAQIHKMNKIFLTTV